MHADIAPEKIENVYARSSFVAQSFVFGDSLRHQLVAIVVPDPEILLPWAASRCRSFSPETLAWPAAADALWTACCGTTPCPQA